MAGRVYAERIRIDRQGYDRRGRYWGVGDPLYLVSDDDSDRFIRAPSAPAAKTQFRLLEQSYTATWPRWRGNPLSRNTLLLGGLGALVLGGIGYAIYKNSQASQAALSSQAQAQLAANQGSVVGVNNQANQLLQQGTQIGNQPTPIVDSA